MKGQVIVKQIDYSARDEEAAELGRRLREIRKRRGFEQWLLAKLATVPVSSVSHFERGKRRPSLETIIRLADVLMVSIDYLVGRTEKTARAHQRRRRRTGPDQTVETRGYRTDRRLPDYVKSQGNYRVDPEDPGESEGSSTPEPEPE